MDVPKLHCLIRAWVVFLLAAAGLPAVAQSIQIIDTFNFLDVRQASVFNVAGTYIGFGADITPAPGMQVTATEAGQTYTIPYINSPALPNQFFRTVPFASSLTGAFTITASDPSGTLASATATTNNLYSGPVTPFITQVQTSDLSMTPTLTWVQPPYANPAGTVASTSIFITDHSVSGNLVVFATGIPSNATSFTVPASFNGTSLIPGHDYVFSVQTTLHDAVTHAEVETARSFFDFRPSLNPPALPGPINLPQVDPSNVFSFNLSVVAGVPVLLDPTVALGYVFKVGANNPSFASVLLPKIGDSHYEVDTWNGTAWDFGATIDALQRYYFGGAGVNEFRVIGIDPSLSLSPSDPTAFATSVSFSGDGEFTGTMTAITEAVPEPETYLLMLVGLGLLGAVHRQRVRHQWIGGGV